MDRPPGNRQSAPPDVIPEVQLDDAARPHVLTSGWETPLIGLAALALGAGLLVGVSNMLNGENGAAVQRTGTPTATFTAIPSLDPQPTATGLPTPSADPTPSEWMASVASVSGDGEATGERLTFDCPPGGAAGTVWGTRVYTHDSSVCTAAVHSGLITFDTGGSVRVEIRPGRDSYRGTTHYGVTSQPYGNWHLSYVFVEAEER
jgi:LCCL domain